MLTPPMNPTVPDSVIRPAMQPTSAEPCSSANTREATLGRSTTASTIPKLVSGKLGATLATPSAKAKPMAKIRSAPASARSCRFSSRFSPPAVGSNSWASIPKSSFARSRPAAAESLNDLSPRPPMS